MFLYKELSVSITFAAQLWSILLIDCHQMTHCYCKQEEQYSSSLTYYYINITSNRSLFGV